MGRSSVCFYCKSQLDNGHSYSLGDRATSNYTTMKLVTIACLSYSLFAVVFSANTTSNDDEDAIHVLKFKDFKKRHKKNYSGPALETVHFKRWKRRWSAIKEHNNQQIGRSSFLLGDNQFADQSEEEWETYLLGVSVPEEFIRGSSQELNTEQQVSAASINVQQQKPKQLVTTSLDLRTNPCMPPVKIQSPCGGCWAFTATTSVEYQTCIKSGNASVVLLSEQQLIDCSASYGAKGCNGGFYSQAWDYIMAVGGQATRAIYPYKGVTGTTCGFTKGVTPVMGNVSRYVYLAKNETTILSALQKGPVTVSIVASPKFILYSSGIFDDDTCKNGTVNHGVVIVGYGQANNTNYWIVRNSWGTSWGQGGHVYMKRDINICRISEFAFLATF